MSEDSTVLTDEQIEKLANKASDTFKVFMAKKFFEKEFKQRSFSGRNPTLGPMIKCAQCGLRHRDNVKHEPIKYANKPGTPEGESNPMIAQTKRFRPVGNKYWRPRPGIMIWIPDLKKYVRLTR
jgi:hypothetical protein